MIVFVWFILSLVIGSFGNSRNIGFWSSFILSLLLSPLIGLIIVLFSKDKVVAELQKKSLEFEKLKTSMKQRFRCKHCGLESELDTFYCVRCLKDNEGFTVEQNLERFNKESTDKAVL